MAYGPYRRHMACRESLSLCQALLRLYSGATQALLMRPHACFTGFTGVTAGVRRAVGAGACRAPVPRVLQAVRLLQVVK